MEEAKKTEAKLSVATKPKPVRLPSGKLGCGDCNDFGTCGSASKYDPASPRIELPVALTPTKSVSGSVVFPKCETCKDLEDVVDHTHNQTLCRTSDEIPEVFGRVRDSPVRVSVFALWQLCGKSSVGSRNGRGAVKLVV
eukprot:760483-Pyramimonas_sp.AAC.1